MRVSGDLQRYLDLLCRLDFWNRTDDAEGSAVVVELGDKALEMLVRVDKAISDLAKSAGRRAAARRPATTEPPATAEPD